MTNFHLTFKIPLLLLVFIPAVFLALWPHFRVSKKYRRTRNRIISLVLHLCMIVLSVSVLSGLGFAYERSNLENEVMLVVDVSHSNKTSDEKKNEFIQAVLQEHESIFKIGIVTFGYGQEYAAELSYNIDTVYNQYLDSLATGRPDDSATDIASALDFAKSKLTSPKTAKIVLMSDGIETDGDALSKIMSMVLDGLKIDTVFFPNEMIDKEVQIIGVELPDYNIDVNESVTIKLTVQSKFAGIASVILTDNDTENPEVPVTLGGGIETFNIKHTFTEEGAHKLHFEIISANDTLQQNNVYYSYLFLEVFNNILIVENDNESVRLNTILKTGNFNTTVVNISDAPDTLSELNQYDQVILVNIANAQLSSNGFDALLYSYVNESGGGLLTVGGDKVINDGGTKKTVANTYNREDMNPDKKPSLYQQMLPVDCIDYTPPIALMIVLDCSLSMTNAAVEGGSATRLDLAKEGAATCVNSLSERDYVGIISFSDFPKVEASLTRVPEKAKVLKAIDAIGVGGGTIYSGAIQEAVKALQAQTKVDRRHIMFITDGLPGDTPGTKGSIYQELIDRYYKEAGITVSGFSIGNEGGSAVKDIATRGHGRYYPVTDTTSLPKDMRAELRQSELTDFIEEIFNPKIKDRTPEIEAFKDADIPELGGFYGVKAKAGVEVPLAGKYDYVPIYAKWKFGKGKVGSFMCNLDGQWSDNFVSSDTGKQLIINIIKGLLPAESIREKGIALQFTEGNYSNKVYINTTLAPGDTLKMTVTGPPDQDGNPWIQTIIPAIEEGFPRCEYKVYQPGIYEIKVEKINSNKKVVDEVTVYRPFSYSAEYDAFVDVSDGELFLTDMAYKGNGMPVSTAAQVFRDHVLSISESIDPKIPFIITAIIMFLLDIAVRKFKFKWPWEIVRDHKAKKLLKQSRN